MTNLFLIVKREYLQRVRAKSFIISTILIPLVFAGIVIVPIILTKSQMGTRRRVAVIDQSGRIYEDFIQRIQERPEKGKPQFVFEKAPATEDLDSVVDGLRARIDKNQLDGYILIGRNIMQTSEAVYYAKNTSNFIDLLSLGNALDSVVINKRLSQEGIDPSRVKALVKKVTLKPIKITKDGGVEEKGQSFVASYILVIILYASLVFYGVLIMRSVIEEKSSRVVEVIISSVRPFDLMLGKLVGVGAVGLTQIFTWGLFLTIVSLYSKVMFAAFAPPDALKLDIAPSLIIYLTIFFVLGYFLFGSMYAAVGAMVNSEQEAQQAQIPILMFLIVPISLMGPIISNPNSPLSIILSLVPFFTPILMFMRICVQSPPLIQILLSMVLLLGTIVFIMWLASKIYRVGILMYGKRPTIPEVVKWLKYS